MTAIVMQVDDLHYHEENERQVQADETVQFALDGVEYDADLTTEHAAELRNLLKRYTSAATPREPAGKRKAVRSSAVGDTPLKQARRHYERMRAFADSRPDLGKPSYLTDGGNFSYTARLRDAYAEYVAEHGEYPLPGEEAAPR